MTLLISTGCASIYQHKGNQWTDQSMPRYLYSGTEADVLEVLPHTDPPPRGRLFGSSSDTIGKVVCFFDLPLSLSVDTLLLPYDVTMVTVGGRTRDGAYKKPPPPAAPPESMTAP